MRWIVWGTLLLTGAAHAASPATVVVGSGDCKDAELQSQIRWLTEAVQPKLGGKLMSEEAVRDRLRPESSRGLDDLQRQLDSAQMQFYQANFAVAEGAINAALTDINRLPPGVERFKLWTRVQLLLALLYRDTRRPESSDEAFRRVLRLSPDYQLDQDFFSPNTRTRFEKLRKDVAAVRKVKLEVRSSPSGAEVFLEGVKLGRTPYVGEVAPGSYALSVVKDQAVSLPRQLNLGGNMSLHVDLAFEGAVQSSRAPCIAEQGGEAMRLANAQKLATLLDVEEVVVVRMDRQQVGPAWLAATVINVQSAQKLREGGVKLQRPDKEPADLAELAKFVVTGEKSDGVVQPPPPSPPQPVVPESEKSSPEAPAVAGSVDSSSQTGGQWKRSAAIASGAVGVGGVAVGTLFLLNSMSTQRELESYYLPGTTSNDPSKKFQILEAQSRKGQQTTLAVVGYGVGAAALGTAAYLWFTKPDENAPVALMPTVSANSFGVAGRF